MSVTNCYNWVMTPDQSVQAYLQRHYMEWINAHGRVRPLGEFAEYIGMKRSRFGNYYNGLRERMDYQTALQISQQLGDFELLDILGYERPSAEDLLAEFPPEWQDRLLAAINEYRSALVSRGIDKDSPEAEEIIKAAFERQGLNPTFTRKS